ncbi:MAG TPA: SusD/RagB family nutrient-binding outer membrane lipoprotein [Bacteroidales bacterium]|nr:SusD/RagB family nutrient-binding outer membrane lipoprotein [Bacteroidales bacterium]
MKRKYIILLVLTAFFAACTDKFEDYNIDKKNPAIVTGEALFSNAQKDLVDQISSTNVNLNVWKLFAQYWTETTYTDEANYDIVNRSIPDLTYREYYRGFLRDFQEATRLITESEPASAVGETEKTNKLAIIELLVCYSYQQLVDIFGDIPYSQAMNIDVIDPAYDDAASIYTDLISRINAALTALDDSEGSFGSADLVYGGDVTAWKKFGNSLKLKLGISLADVSEGVAEATVLSAITGGVFESNGDNALFGYQLASPNYNPLYEDLIASGRKDFVAANTIIDIMDDLADPRLAAYFTMVDTSTEAGMEKLAYVGGTYGESSPYSLYSHIADPIQAADFDGIIMTYDEVLFYLAEAAARGWAVGATDEELYNAAITASFEFWGLSSDDADDYLTTPDVAWATAAGDWREKIGTQAWIAFYTRGLEGYTSWRRLDYPVLNIPPAVDNYSEIPLRFTYPVNEQTLNKANWQTASQNIGGDLVSTPLFWDTVQPVR